MFKASHHLVTHEKMLHLKVCSERDFFGLHAVCSYGNIGQIWSEQGTGDEPNSDIGLDVLK